MGAGVHMVERIRGVWYQHRKIQHETWGLLNEKLFYGTTILLSSPRSSNSLFSHQGLIASISI